jgi:hypothetical protein
MLDVRPAEVGAEGVPARGRDGVAQEGVLEHRRGDDGVFAGVD